jgi:predicted nucleotidyltransferase
MGWCKEGIVGDQALSDRLVALARRYTGLLEERLGERLVSVALFGSVARGTAAAHSDIDLFVVIRDLPRGAFRRREVVEAARGALLPELERLWEAGIYADFVELLRTPEEAERFHLLYLDMTDEALLLHDRDGFLAERLERVRERMAELGTTRRRIGNVTYWDLKPDMRPGEVIRLWWTRRRYVQGDADEALDKAGFVLMQVEKLVGDNQAHEG